MEIELADWKYCFPFRLRNLRYHRHLAFCAFALLWSVQVSAPQAKQVSEITRATLNNGLRVVIIRNPLAPIVTVEQNYLVGGDETPDGFPGMAHAQEHMAFRGCDGISSDQTAAMYAQLGGLNNADTQQNITQYFATVPAADLDIALRIDAACMRHIEDADTEWAQERGAIEQEVARDLSNPTYKFLTRMNEDLFSGTPYAHDALGTKASFDATTSAMLKKFAQDWYRPNNALLVVVGDVDPKAALVQIDQYYGSIPKRALPARPPVRLKPVKTETFTLDSNLPYLLTFIAYRLPGTDSGDYAAAQILVDVLGSPRGNLYALVPDGKALAAQFGMAESYPLASVGFAMAALPAAGDGAAIAEKMKQILSDYASHGVPTELVEAAKRQEIAGAEFQRNSIPGLAAEWSQSLAADGRNSPEEEIDAMKAVKPADVNRLAKKYLQAQNSVVGILKPLPAGGPVAPRGFGGSEKLTSEPTKPVMLPDWAAGRLLSLEVPPEDRTIADTQLPNGLRLIVKTVTASPTITVRGIVKHEANLETPPGKEGTADVLEELFSYGTRTLDRLAFQKSLDDIAANESAGFNFSVRILKNDFSRGVQLLADNELHPAFPAAAFEIVKRETAEFTRGNLKSPGYRAGRALTEGLLPPGDPDRREITPQGVEAVTLEDVKQYHAKTIRPDLTTIVVIGDVSAGQARSVIEKWFGDWKTPDIPPEVTLPPVPASKVSAVNVPDPSELQDNVTLAEQLEMNRFDPNYYALELGNHVLGGGFYATRLYRDLRQLTGYVYTVDVILNATRSRATYTVIYACDPKNTAKAHALIARDLADMQTNLVTPGELQQAKALLLHQLALRESSEDAVADGLLARARIGLPLDEPIRAAHRYFDLTAEQLRETFRKWIHPDGFVEVVRGPAPL